MTGHVVYLHGFPSSPKSTKAQRFAVECAARGIAFSCPDFNQPLSETPTIARMIGQARAAIEAAGERPVMLVGSSLGGFVAVHAAAADTTGRVAELVLLAPAFDLGDDRVFEDVARYDAFALTLTLPIRIFQGTADDTVLPASVSSWAEGRPNVDITWLDDNHQLAASVETIVQAVF